MGATTVAVLAVAGVAAADGDDTPSGNPPGVVVQDDGISAQPTEGPSPNYDDDHGRNRGHDDDDDYDDD
jgi:hypothetical protein